MLHVCLQKENIIINEQFV